jgi:hypothetical protein
MDRTSTDQVELKDGGMKAASRAARAPPQDVAGAPPPVYESLHDKSLFDRVLVEPHMLGKRRQIEQLARTQVHLGRPQDGGAFSAVSSDKKFGYLACPHRVEPGEF